MKKERLCVESAAGAICWFDSGITDSWSSDLRLMNCLAFYKEPAALILMKSQSEDQLSIE